MATIFDVVTAPALAAYYLGNPMENPPYLLGAFFPNRKQLGTDLSYIKGAKGAVKPLSLSGYDAKAIPIDREGFEKLMTEIPFFKNMMLINEKQRKELLNFMAANNEAAIQMVVNNIFNDQARLVDNAMLTLEMMRAQAITTGKVTFSSNGQSITVDYGVPEDNFVDANWTVATSADPLNDILGWQDTVEASYGTRPRTLIMNSKTFGLIQKSDSIKDAIYVMGNGSVTPTRSRTADFISTEADVDIYIYNKGYMNGATFTKFIPDNTVVMLPNSTVGYMNFAPTPEETDLLTGSNANVSILGEGIAVTMTKETDPVSVMTKVSMCALPSLEGADGIIVADVSGSGL